MDDESILVRAIVRLKEKRPFDPFRIVTAGGEKLLIAEPAMVMIPEGPMIRVFARSGRLVQVAKKDIVAIEELKVIAVV